MSAKSVIAPPENRVKALDRPQKFLQGFMDISELSDEEVQGLFIYNDAGQKVDSIALGLKMHQQIAQELHRRMNRFLQTKTASMLNVMVDIAESDLVEPADRIKAATWVAERVLGKTPEIIMHGKVDAPYEAIFETIDAGSRENYRQEIGETRLELGRGTDEILDAEIVGQSEYSDFQEDDSGSSSSGDEESDDGSNLESARRASAQRDEIQRQKEIKKARVKAKQRRYAARATGATTVHDVPWAVEWKFLIHGEDKGHFRLKVVCPNDLTENRVAKIEQSNAQALVLAEQWRNNVA